MSQSDACRRRDVEHINGGGPVGPAPDRPVPELAFTVEAPALHRAARQQGTRVVVFRTATQSEARRRRDARHINGGGAVGPAPERPVPELAVKVVAPALHRAARQRNTRVALTQSDACPLRT